MVRSLPRRAKIRHSEENFRSACRPHLRLARNIVYVVPRQRSVSNRARNELAVEVQEIPSGGRTIVLLLRAGYREK
jgi:hypothetical protein